MASQCSAVKTKQGYVNGAIVRIYLRNFMTYSEFENFPGPRMNVIVGPNGTGKSTILCGICLGLGGKSTMLGRATSHSGFIKHDCEKAEIEIELCNVNGGNYIVRRNILKSNQSTWELNGAPSNQKTVDALMEKLNIQMKNLCQFLPQDRVADFVKLTPELLLENTEKAAGNQGMYEDHCVLMKDHSTFKDLETNFARVKDDYDREMQKKNRMKEHVNIFKEKKHHLEKIAMLEKKIVWVEYELARQNVAKAKEMNKEKRNELEELKARLNPLKMKTLEAGKSVDKVDIEIKELVTKIRNSFQKLEGQARAVENYNDKMGDVIATYQSRKQMEDQRIARINQVQMKIDNLEQDLRDLTCDEENVAIEMEAVTKELTISVGEITACQVLAGREKDMQRRITKDLEDASAELRKMNDVSQQRLTMLRQRHPHTYDATMWLRQNRDKFRGEIHEPLMLVLNVTDPKWAKYVERQIPFRDLIAFVCEDPDDIETFLALVRDQQKLKVNAVMAPPKSSKDFNPVLPLEQIRTLGFQSYLREAIDAPEAVLSYLCSQYHVYNVPVGNDYTKQNITRVFDESPFNYFYTANHQYTCSVSRYGNNARSTRCSELNMPRILIANLDRDRQQQLNKNIQDYRNQLQEIDSKFNKLIQQERSITAKMEELRNKKKELTKQRDARKTMMFTLEQHKASLKACEEGQIDLAKEKQLAMVQMKNYVETKEKLLMERAEALKETFEICICRVKIDFRQKRLMLEKRQAEKMYRDNSANLTMLETEVSKMIHEMTTLQNVAKALLAKAQKETGITSAILPESVQDSFNLLPATLEELEDDVHQLRVKVDCLLDSDDNAEQTYEQWKSKVKALSTEMEMREQELLSYQQDMKTIEKRWLKPLNELINHVNIRFGRYFKSLDCVGEVTLKKGPDEKDYKRYGICIKVKFRSSEPLRELTSTYQSGGERSVATILYLLALQEFIKLPFCCVDEINQGMDSINEQRVLQLMTQTLCNESLSQYFLVTPKLLMNSEFEDNVTIHWIYNGIIIPRSMDLNKIIRRKRHMK